MIAHFSQFSLGKSAAPLEAKIGKLLNSTISIITTVTLTTFLAWRRRQP
jgi:hypothetical protein